MDVWQEMHTVGDETAPRIFFPHNRPFLHNSCCSAVATYLKKVHHKYLTGTVTSNRAGVDKFLQFTMKKGIPRGFYKWSEDEHNGVVQVTWVDRKPVQLLSTAHGAFHSGVLRLTS